MSITRQNLYFILLLLFLFASCKKSSNPAATGNKNADGTVNTGLDNQAMLKLVNDVRAKGCTCGVTVMAPVPALNWNEVLAAAALSHSQDMKATGILSHNSSDGTAFSDRITAAGYKWQTVGENIASGQTTEQTVFNAWLQSEDHCKNMMNGSFKEFGAARAGNYWTQDFGAQ